MGIIGDTIGAVKRAEHMATRPPLFVLRDRWGAEISMLFPLRDNLQPDKPTARALPPLKFGLVYAIHGIAAQRSCQEEIGAFMDKRFPPVPTSQTEGICLFSGLLTLWQGFLGDFV